MPSPTDRNLTALPTKTVKLTAKRQARHFTRLDQVTQLVNVRDADPELGYMARLLALCSLPRTNQGSRLQYVRCKVPLDLNILKKLKRSPLGSSIGRSDSPARYGSPGRSSTGSSA